MPRSRRERRARRARRRVSTRPTTGWCSTRTLLCPSWPRTHRGNGWQPFYWECRRYSSVLKTCNHSVCNSATLLTPSPFPEVLLLLPLRFPVVLSFPVSSFPFVPSARAFSVSVILQVRRVLLLLRHLVALTVVVIEEPVFVQAPTFSPLLVFHVYEAVHGDVAIERLQRIVRLIPLSSRRGALLAPRLLLPPLSRDVRHLHSPRQ
mmetsp:Transcript_30058/g.71531  ORF Transcript_30058/g.71531 Transcript_30058/m.71531 type:complete len:206 (+) Transcript_30058:959-1576(+)